jgi:two-component system, OmpR family, response regulator
MSRKYKIFIVDDEAMVRRMIEFKLKDREDLEVHSFPSGETCLENLSLNPDIIILDYHMDTESEDAMNGLDTLLKIVELAPEVKVAMLSSQDNVGVAVDVLKKGAVDYIIKNSIFTVNTESAIDKIIQRLELKAEINELTARIKRDKLLMRGYSVAVGFLALLAVYFLLFR